MVTTEAITSMENEFLNVSEVSLEEKGKYRLLQKENHHR